MSTTRSRTDHVAARLREEILRGAYQPGDRLPAERDLAVRLGVNRGAVREALKKLEQLGLVRSRRGGGTTVRPLQEASLEVVRHLLFVDGEVNRALLEQILDVHEMLVAGASRLAVERGGTDDLARARELLADLGAARESERERELFDAIVELVTRASGNLVLRLVRNVLHGSLGSGLHDVQRLMRPEPRARAAHIRAIDAALEARDAVATEEAVRALLRARRERLRAALATLDSRASERARSRSGPDSETSLH